MKHSCSFLHHVSLLIILSMLALLPALAAPSMAQAMTYYVSLSGNDTNSGTSASSAFRTFARATKPLKPGDTLYIRGGIWTQQIDLQTPNITGTSGNYVKIAGYPGEKVTIQYADPIENGYGPIKARGARGYLIFENLVLDGINSTRFTGWQIRDGNHDFILRNLEIKNFRSSNLFLYGASNVQVVNCKIHHAKPATAPGSGGSYYYALYAHHGSNIVVQGSEIYSNSGGGLHFYPGPLSNVIVRSNSIHDNNYISTAPVGGIIVYGSSSSRITNTQIYNNLVFRNGSASTAGTAPGIVIGRSATNTKVWNNTIYGNKGYGLLAGYDTTVSGTLVQNNISYGNTSSNYYAKGSNTTATNNITTQDPKFVNASLNNFQLQSSSPAINSGVQLTSVPIDYRNLSRPKGSTHDIGGYENY